MKFFETLDRIQHLHSLIQDENTGTPVELAQKLGISRKSVYNLIGEMKVHKAPISYSRRRKTFFYREPYEFNLNAEGK